MSRRQYRRGRAVRSIEEFQQLGEGGALFCMANVPAAKNYAFMIGWPFRQLVNAIKAGRLFVAEKIQEDKQDG